MPVKLRRREALKVSGAAAMASMLGLPSRALAQADDQKFLFVIAANGGGNITDSLLPIADSESTASGTTLITWPDQGALNFIGTVSGSNLRCVHDSSGVGSAGLGLVPGEQLGFLQDHHQDTAVMTVQGTSVNHLVAAKRALTGAGANKGRTILEEVAMRHGEGMLLPQCNMGEGGYIEPGDDPTVPNWARAETIADAALFPVATDGIRGVEGAPERSLVERARRVREELEHRSVFARSFRDAPLLQRYLNARRSTVPNMEVADLITKLMMVPDAPPAVPLSDYGLESSPELATLDAAFPNILSDPFDAQGALAFLLARYRVSCSMLITPSFSPRLSGLTLENPPLAFDFSHTQHYVAQYNMWSRIFRVAGALINLLKAQDFDDNDPGKGKMWDRSLVYIATEFGRSKERAAVDDYDVGTGHHLSNGVILCSPLLNGNQVYGGVDTATGLTYGFDRNTGAAAPGTVMSEADVYSVIASAMGITYPGQVEVPCMIA